MRTSGRTTCITLLMLLFTVVLSGAAHADIRLQDDDSSRIHRLHVLMNHGLIMFLDGINLLMVADMKMSPAFDEMTADYAKRNMAKGKKDIEQALAGDHMEILVEQGFEDHPLMKAAKDMGRTMLELVYLLEDMEMDQFVSKHMDLHHMHLLLNKGLKDVASGSNMIMATLLSSIPQVDQYLQMHGRNMIKDGRALIVGITQSDAYRRLQGKPDSPGGDRLVRQTKQCVDLSLRIVDILARMEMGEE